MMILILSFLVPLSVAAKPAYPRQTCLNVFNSLGKLAENLDVANITVADLEKACDVAAPHIEHLDAGHCKAFVGDHYRFIVEAIQINAVKPDVPFGTPLLCAFPDEPEIILALADAIHDHPDLNVDQITPENLCGLATQNVDVDVDHCQDFVGQYLGEIKQAVETQRGASDRTDGDTGMYGSMYTIFTNVFNWAYNKASDWWYSG